MLKLQDIQQAFYWFMVISMSDCWSEYSTCFFSLAVLKIIQKFFLILSSEPHQRYEQSLQSSQLR